MTASWQANSELNWNNDRIHANGDASGRLCLLA